MTNERYMRDEAHFVSDGEARGRLLKRAQTPESRSGCLGIKHMMTLGSLSPRSLELTKLGSLEPTLVACRIHVPHATATIM